MKTKLFAILLSVLLLVIAGCSEAPSKAPEAPVASQAQESQDSAQPQAKTAEPEVPVELKLKVGETAKTSKLEVTVLSAKKVPSYEYYSEILGTQVKEAVPGKVFILAEAEIKNVGADSVFVGYSQFSATDSEGYSYNPTLYYGQQTDGLDIVKQLYQNQKIKGKFLFEVPEESKNMKLLYDFGNLLIGTKLASWSLQ